MKRAIARGLGATAMLVLLSGAAAAQPAGSDWGCTSWRETPPTYSASPGRECAQWSKGQAAAAPIGQLPPPPFAQGAKPGDAKAKAADAAAQKTQKRKKKHRRRR